MLIDGVQGNKVYDETRMEIENLTGYNNESAAVLNRWQAQGNISNVPRALANGTTNAANAALLQSQVSSLYVEDGSFVRMRNATLSYKVNQKTIKTDRPVGSSYLCDRSKPFYHHEVQRILS